MRQSTLKKRPRNGKFVYYCEIAGKQYGLGTNYKFANRRFGELMANRPTQSSPSVKEIISRFLLWGENPLNLEPSTFKWYTEHLFPFKKEYGHLRVSELRKHHLTAWLDKTCKNVKANTRNVAIRAITRPFNWAVSEDLISDSPLAGYKLARSECREFFVKPDQWQEIQKLIAGKRFDDFRDYLTVLWETGCRPHEIRIVRSEWINWDFKRWVFPVSKSKGKRHKRVVYLTETAFEITKRLAEKNPTGPIFRRKNGKPWDKNVVRCKFRRLKQLLELPELCAYSFRHGFSTKLLEQGIPATVVATLLGHQSTRMLETRYGHIDQNPQFLLAQLNHSQPVKSKPTKQKLLK
jgi:integrase